MNDLSLNRRRLLITGFLGLLGLKFGHKLSHVRVRREVVFPRPMSKGEYFAEMKVSTNYAKFDELYAGMKKSGQLIDIRTTFHADQAWFDYTFSDISSYRKWQKHLESTPGLYAADIADARGFVVSWRDLA